MKLRTEQRYDPSLVVVPVLTTGPANDGLNDYKLTEYAGNIIYETMKSGSVVTNKTRILIDGGYIENNQYHFYLTDHLGNNRVVANASGTAIQKNHYYPFGMPYAETSATEQGKQPYKFGDKELDQMHGLNHYDFSARYMDGIRFTTIDPLAEKDYSWSPYVYCANNPIKFFDPDGREKLNGLYKYKRDENGEVIIDPKTGKPEIDKIDAATAEKRFNYDNDMVHIYAHGSGDGFTYMDEFGNESVIRSDTDLRNFLNKNSKIWNDRQKGEEIYLVLHACGVGVEIISRGIYSWIDIMSMNFPEIIFVGPNSLLEITTKGETVLNSVIPDHKSAWNFYYQGVKFNSRLGTPENNPDMMQYSRPSWTKANNFIERAKAAGASIYYE